MSLRKSRRNTILKLMRIGNSRNTVVQFCLQQHLKQRTPLGYSSSRTIPPTGRVETDRAISPLEYLVEASSKLLIEFVSAPRYLWGSEGLGHYLPGVVTDTLRVLPSQFTAIYCSIARNEDGRHTLSVPPLDATRNRASVQSLLPDSPFGQRCATLHMIFCKPQTTVYPAKATRFYNTPEF